MPHAEHPDSSPLQESSSPEKEREEPNHNHEREVDPIQEDVQLSDVEASKPGGSLDDMFDDDDEDEFTSSGAQAPM